MPRFLGALLACALALSACSGSEPPERPAPGGTLRVSVRDLGALDPATASGRGALLAISQLWDPLTSIDPSTGRAIPGAASSWTVSADALTWSFTIAPATFHDGTPVTAVDFKAGFDRIARKATNSDVAFQFEAVKGFHASKIAGTAPRLAGVVALTQTTLRIVLDRPFAELPVFLAHPALVPLPKAIVAKPATLLTQPAGNGAFKMSAARAPDLVTLERFPEHAGGSALLDRIEIRLVSESDQGWRDFLAGRTDVAEVPAEAIPTAGGRAGRAGFGPFWAALYYGLNLKNPVFAKPEVRKAISLAIDRQQIAEVVYGGTKEAATGIIPRGVRGYEQRACADCARDVDRARTIFTAAFGASPPELIIDHLNASPSKEVAEAVAGDLRDAGVRVALRAQTSANYLRVLQAGQHQIAELGWLSEVPSPDGFLAQQLRTGSANNHTFLADKTFDGLVDQARAAPDEAARIDAYRKAETRAFELMPLIPIVFFRNHVAVGSRIRALRIDGAGLFDAARVWISRA